MTHLSIRKAAAVAGFAALLAGCTTVFPHGIFGRRHLAVAPAVVQPNDPGSSDVDDGRRLLDAGLTGAAIEAFQRALGRGESIASAANGLGVGYARIGRSDLAFRYFTQASQLDPSNSGYAGNLARVNITRLLDAAVAEWAVETPILSAPRDIQDTGNARAPTMSQLIRVSPHEVRLLTASAQRAPTYRPAQYMISFARPVIRVTAANTKPATRSAELDSKPIGGLDGGRKVIMLASRAR